MKEKEKKKSIWGQPEIDSTSWSGRLAAIIVIVIVIILIIVISQNTSSFYDWYPGKGIDDMRRNDWQNK